MRSNKAEWESPEFLAQVRGKTTTTDHRIVFDTDHLSTTFNSLEIAEARFKRRPNLRRVEEVGKARKNAAIALSNLLRTYIKVYDAPEAHDAIVIELAVDSQMPEYFKSPEVTDQVSQAIMDYPSEDAIKTLQQLANMCLVRT